MGRYQAYSEYKNSGMDWLGVIPNKWEILKFKFTSKEGKAFASGPFGSSIGSQFYRDSGVPVIRGNNLSLNANKPKFVDDGYVFIDKNKADELSNAEVIRGDLVFTARGTVGQVGLIPCVGDLTWERAILSANQLRFRNHKTGFSSNFLWYLFSSWLIRTQVLLSSDSVAQPNLNLGSLKDLHLLKPSFEEQVSIADFLDHETAKIDTLIAKQEKLIELLKEKRQAVISHSVTKGLNSNVPMKDSGIEWLGEVPAHWNKKVFKQVIRTRKGIAFSTSYFCDSGIRVVKASDIKQLSLRQSDVFLPVEFISKYPKAHLTTGNIVLSTVGSNPDVKNSAVGQIAMVPKELDNTLLNQNTVIFDPIDDAINRDYLFFLLQTKAYRDHLDLHAHGTANQASLNVADMLDFRCICPPISEQKTISEYLYKFLSKVSTLENKVANTILLMKERKTALISAAVTGKIDVRDWKGAC